MPSSSGEPSRSPMVVMSLDKTASATLLISIASKACFRREVVRMPWAKPKERKKLSFEGLSKYELQQILEHVKRRKNIPKTIKQEFIQYLEKIIHSKP